MTISLSDAGKRYNREWIFRHLDYFFESGQSYAITGPNGSGKSTLLQAIGGAIHINEGSITYQLKGKAVPTEHVFRQVAICAPYLEVIEEMTVMEFLEFHASLKSFLPGIDVKSIIDEVGLQAAAHKQIRYYSSGMKQRVKLAQCFFSDTPLLLLDEPCTNLDAPGIDLYYRLISEYGKNRLIVVSSNDETEYRFCEKKIDARDFVPPRKN